MKFVAIVTTDKFGIPRKVELCHSCVAHFVLESAGKDMEPGSEVRKCDVTEHWSAAVYHPMTESEKDCNQIGGSA